MSECVHYDIVLSVAPEPPAELPPEKPEDYYRAVRAIAGRVASTRNATAEDLTQSAMLVLVRRWGEFDAAQCPRAAWVRKLSRWAMMDAIRDGTARLDVVQVPRSKAGGGAVPACGPLAFDPAAPEEPEPIDEAEFVADFEARLGRTANAREREIVVGHFCRGWPYSNIARTLGASATTVKREAQGLYAECRERAAEGGGS